MACILDDDFESARLQRLRHRVEPAAQMLDPLRSKLFEPCGVEQALVGKRVIVRADEELVARVESRGGISR